MSTEDEKTSIDVMLDLELKQLTKDDPEGTFEGYASTGGVDGHGDIVARGAFTEALKNRGPGTPNPIPILWSHDLRDIIGISKVLKQDSSGRLYTKAELALGVPSADRAYILMKAGALKMSVGMRFNSDGYDINPNTGVRTITKAEIFEISLVGVPANDRARITAVKSIRDWEHDLHEKCGLSRSDAKWGAKALNEALNQREVGNAKKAESNNDDGLREALQSARRHFAKAAEAGDEELARVLKAALAKPNA